MTFQRYARTHIIHKHDFSSLPLPYQKSSESGDFILDGNGMFRHCDALNFDAAYQKMKGNASAGSLSLINSPDAQTMAAEKRGGTVD